jgi:predicted ester cyclase
VEDLVAEFDKVIARTRAHGIHRGTYLELAATGQPVTYTKTFTFRITDRKIAEWWIDVNCLGILQQIGVAVTVPNDMTPSANCREIPRSW